MSLTHALAQRVSKETQCTHSTDMSSSMVAEQHGDDGDAGDYTGKRPKRLVTKQTQEQAQEQKPQPQEFQKRAETSKIQLGDRGIPCGRKWLQLLILVLSYSIW